MLDTKTDLRLQAAVAYWKSAEKSCFEQTILSYGNSSTVQVELNSGPQQYNRSAAAGSSANWTSPTRNLRAPPALSRKKVAPAILQVAAAVVDAGQPTPGREGLRGQVKQHVKV